MAVSDPNISVLISGRTGTNGATSYTDELGSVFAASGSAAMTTTSPAYGPSAMQITGAGTGDYWSTLATTPWVLGSGDFCVEIWVNQTSNEAIYLDNSGQNGNAGWRIGLYNSGSGASGYSVYWYSDVGGFFDFGLSVAPNGSGNRYFRFERISGTVSVYDGTGRVGQYTDATNYNIAGAVAYLGRANNDLTFRPFTGKIYAQITKGGNRGGGGAATLPAVPSPYAFLTPTVDPFPQQTASVGGTATFTPTYSGAAATSYQWKRNGVAISGATGASYTTGTLSASDNGALYSVIATNSNGSSTEVGAYLFIRDIKTGLGRNIRGWAFGRHQIALTTPLLLPDQPLVDGPDSGALSWQDWFGLSVPTTNQYTLSVDPAAYAIAAAPVAVNSAQAGAVDPAAYNITAAPVSTGRAYGVTVDPAAYAAAWAAVGATSARGVSFDPAAYAIVAAPVGVARATGGTVDPAAYSIALAAVSAGLARTASVDPAAYLITAAPVAPTRQSVDAVAPVAYAITVAPVTVQAGRVLAVSPAAYSIAAAPVTTTGNAPGSVDPAAYTIATPAVGGGVNRALQVLPAAYSIAAAPVAPGLARTAVVPPVAYAIGFPPAGNGRTQAANVAPLAYALGLPSAGTALTRAALVDPLAYSIATPDVGTAAGFSVGIDPLAYGIEWPDVTGDQGVEITHWVFTTVPTEIRRATIAPERRQSTIAPESRRWSMKP